MLKLEPHNQIEVTEESISKFLDFYGINNFTFDAIKEGISNISLLVKSQEKKYVLRIYAQERKTNEEINFEIKFQDYLRSHNVPIPKIYPNRQGEEMTVVKLNGKSWQSILMELVEGSSVTNNPSDHLIKELANIQARMHILGIDYSKNEDSIKDPLTSLRDYVFSKLPNILVNDKEVLEFVKRVKAYEYNLDPNLPQGWNHLDINFDGNVITKDNKVEGILDFDDLLFSPPVVCLGFTLWSIFDESGLDAIWLYLEEYQKIRPLTSLEFESLPHIIFFRNYSIGAFRLLLWEEDTPMKDIEDILKLEKEIPNFFSGQNN